MDWWIGRLVDWWIGVAASAAAVDWWIGGLVDCLIDLVILKDYEPGTPTPGNTNTREHQHPLGPIDEQITSQLRY